MSSITIRQPACSGFFICETDFHVFYRYTFVQLPAFVGSAYIYGIEYKDGSSTSTLFDFSDIESGGYLHYNVPCAVCFTQSRITQVGYIMIL